MQIAHFILDLSIPACKIAPLPGHPVLRDAAAAHEPNDGNAIPRRSRAGGWTAPADVETVGT
jgi:hypothetical protein